MAGLSPKLPIGRDSEDGYSLTKTYEEMVRQNLKNLLLTNPGERMMDPDFGVGIKRYLFDQHGVGTYSEIYAKSLEQVGKYMPFVSLEKMEFFGPDGIWATDTGASSTPSQAPNSDPNTLQIKMYFVITPIDEMGTLDLDFAV